MYKMANIFKLVLLTLVTESLSEYSYYRWNDYEPRFYNYNNIGRQKATAAGKGVTKVTTKATTKATTKVRDLSKTYFQSLESYSVEATPVSETKYPWIAKVVHSKTMNYPYVCTAVCVEERLFITAARCLVNLKIILTTVIYQKNRFPAEVFVLPSEPSKQMYDDIGIIVTMRNNYKGKWSTINVYRGQRADDKFQWFSNLKLRNLVNQHKAVGYVIKKSDLKARTPTMEHILSEIDILIDIQMCSNILSRGMLGVESFYVPCYHSCNESQYNKRAVSCRKFLGTEGAAVINSKTNTLMGVATWGTNSMGIDLPVGFAVPNSINYLKDIACARKIKNDVHYDNAYRGYFQSLCIM